MFTYHSDQELLDVVEDFGLLQLMLDAGLTHDEVALHLHHTGLIDLDEYLNDEDY
tara:strand:- start:371 stop:535 length:165 start_codon:yes stop_codon:yes gene_type:complete